METLSRHWSDAALYGALDVARASRRAVAAFMPPCLPATTPNEYGRLPAFPTVVVQSRKKP